MDRTCCKCQLHTIPHHDPSASEAPAPPDGVDSPVLAAFAHDHQPAIVLAEADAEELVVILVLDEFTVVVADRWVVLGTIIGSSGGTVLLAAAAFPCVALAARCRRSGRTWRSSSTCRCTRCCWGCRLLLCWSFSTLCSSRRFRRTPLEQRFPDGRTLSQGQG